MLKSTLPTFFCCNKIHLLEAFQTHPSSQINITSSGRWHRQLKTYGNACSGSCRFLCVSIINAAGNSFWTRILHCTSLERDFTNPTPTIDKEQKKEPHIRDSFWEATTGIGPVIRVLQTEPLQGFFLVFSVLWRASWKHCPLYLHLYPKVALYICCTMLL